MQPVCESVLRNAVPSSFFVWCGAVLFGNVSQAGRCPCHPRSFGAVVVMPPLWFSSAKTNLVASVCVRTHPESAKYTEYASGVAMFVVRPGLVFCFFFEWRDIHVSWEGTCLGNQSMASTIPTPAVVVRFQRPVACARFRCSSLKGLGQSQRMPQTALRSWGCFG